MARIGRSTVNVIPTKTASEEKPEFAGDYILKHVFIHNHVGEVVDVKNIMIELNIYESIYKNAVTGTIVIADTTNQIAKLKIQGLERISFQLSTPGVKYGKEGVIDASEKTGHPFHVYKITDRKQLNQNLTSYTLHFASREFMRNLRTKVSQAYDGTLDRAVIAIMDDENYLDSRKKLRFETTGNKDKIVIPNLSPFDAINMIASRSIPEKSNGVGYYFYETTRGFNFRSWESMITSQGQFAKVPKQQFYNQPLKMASETKQDKIEKEFESVEAYEFVNNFHDVAINTILGTYGHKVITHNLYTKSYDIDDYGYHDEFSKTAHTDTIGKTGSYTTKFAVAHTPVDYDNAKNLSDYPESRVSLQPTSSFLHDEDVGRYGLDTKVDGKKTGQGVSQYNQIVHGTALKMTVKGQSYIQAGDLIEFNLVTEQSVRNADNDPRFSGNYVITKIRHKVDKTQYKMILECAKDSVATSYGSGSTNPMGYQDNPKTASQETLQLEVINNDWDFYI